MGKIQLLDQITINKIAAGEVIDRPASVVKELLENSIDAGSTNISIEIKDGGISLIRITDNGCGFNKDDIKIAFLRHSTSKISSVDDLLAVSSLGFRGEALSSIAAVAMVELITKTKNSVSGYRYKIEGGKETDFDEIGVPEGTTIIIRNLFYNTPARRKFLKSPQTEAGYIEDIVEHLCLSHPEVSINFINNGRQKIHTPGNNDLKDNIYNIYGREIAANLLYIEDSYSNVEISGYIGKPVISRGNRSFENYFVNGRYIKNTVITKAIEDAYGNYMMQHKYPFTVLHLLIPNDLLDINVHPSKMEIRIKDSDLLYANIYNSVKNALSKKEFIPEIESEKENIIKNLPAKTPEPFEIKSRNIFEEKELTYKYANSIKNENIEKQTVIYEKIPKEVTQISFNEATLLNENSRPFHKIIGQVFDTYWIVQLEDKLYIIDQHAAHEKVLFEKTMKRLADKEIISQPLNPPIIITMSATEEEFLNKYYSDFKDLGFEIEHFGGREYAVRAIPYDLYSINSNDILTELIGSLSEETSNLKSELITEKIASMSCKAAVKGNNKLSLDEINSLIDQLLMLENPYNCPHGRPTIITMSKYELEKKFKRII